ISTLQGGSYWTRSKTLLRNPKPNRIEALAELDSHDIACPQRSRAYQSNTRKLVAKCAAAWYAFGWFVPLFQELSMHDHDACFGRRDFLRTAGAMAVGLGLSPQLGRIAAMAPNGTPQPEQVDVGIARGSNMEEAVRRAVKLAGGMGFIKEGQTVL